MKHSIFRIGLLIAILFTYSNCYSQCKKGELIISGRSDFINYSSYKSRLSGGVQLDLFISKNISIYSRIAFGERYIHTSFTPLVNYNNFPRIGIEAIILSLFIPEGVSFYIPINKKISLSPTIGILSFEVIDDNHNSGFKLNNIGFAYNPSIGLKLNFIMNKNIILSPQISKNYLLGINKHGFSGTITFGILL